jgi:small GTP-binding protein
VIPEAILEQDSAHKVKLSIIGDGKVGKTSLCTSLQGERISGNYDITIGVDISTTVLGVNGQRAKLILWDLGGQAHFACVRPSFYRGARCALVVFDLANRGSFYDVRAWIRELRRHTEQNGERIPFVLVGNKADLLEREVDQSEAEALAAEMQVPYVETSAAKNKNVEEAFRIAVLLAMRQQTQKIAPISSVTSW